MSGRSAWRTRRLMPRAILSQRRAVLDDVNTIAAYAQDMSEFLNESELTERRAFIETFVKEIVVIPGDALLCYTIPISQSTPKTAVLLGGRPEELWVGSTAEAPSQLAWKTGPFYRGGGQGEVACRVRTAPLIRPGESLT